jgi:hypothetical protein
MKIENDNNLDDLMLGNVGEDVKESDEHFAARVAAAQTKLAQIKKDESGTRDFDRKLAKIIPHLDPHTLNLVVFLINHEVPSLTILAMISLASNEAGKICYSEFHKSMIDLADFSPSRLGEKTKEKASLWWSFIFAADGVSHDIKLSQLRHDDSFVEFISLSFSQMLQRFLEQEKEEGFDKAQLENILGRYQEMMFEEGEKQ